MRQFALKVNGKSYNCDTEGVVADDSANVIGKWTTTANNNIRIVPDSETPIDAAVEWSFNNSNQLMLRQDGTTIFTILAIKEDLPRYWLAKNMLYVDPDGDGDFDFPLKCQWGLDPSGNLRVTINGTTSIIDGYIEDSQSRFRFKFYDKELPNYPSSLVFSGAWERVKTNNEEIRLHFVLQDPSLEEPAAPLNLPQAVKVDPTRNNLALIYQSASYGVRRLEFLGSLEIKPNWTVTFKIADTKDGGVKSTKITVDTTFNWDASEASVSLYVGKTKQPNSQQIEVGGRLQAKLKNGKVDWALAYRKGTGGGQSSMVIATSCTFVYKDSSIWIQYTQSGKSWAVDVGAKIIKKDYVISGGVEIKNDPEGRRLGGFLSVSF